MSLSLLLSLPTEIIIEIATLLDAPSLAHFELTCKVLRDVVNNNTSLQYMLALAARGLCDGSPSPVTAMSRLELLKAHEEAWRTFSWSEHLALDIPDPYTTPYVSGGTLVLPIRGAWGFKSFVVQSIPSPLRGVPGRRWQIELEFFAETFIIDATQDLLAVVPIYDTSCVLMLTLSTGQPHPLSANEGIFRLEGPRYVSEDNSQHEISGDFIGIIITRDEDWDRLLIWNWKTGAVHVEMQIRAEHHHDGALVSFLDNGHFVVLTRRLGSPGGIYLNVYQHSQQRWKRAPPVVCGYTLFLSDKLTRDHSLRFFPDLSQGGAPPGHFYADAAKRVIGIQIEEMCGTTGRGTVQELLIPVRALMGEGRCPQRWRVRVCYEPFFSRQLAYALRAMERQIPAEKLPPALRDVDASQLRFTVYCGALLVFEHDRISLKKLHILAF